MTRLPFPTSLPEFQRLFPDDAACATYLERIRWSDGPHDGWKGEPCVRVERQGIIVGGRCHRSPFCDAVGAEQDREPRLVHPPAVVGLAPRLRPWARQIALRFGRAVWLVGSALELPDPRDVDVRVLLSSEEFTARYGDPAEWHKALWWPNRNDGSLRYAADVWDLSREASLELHLNIDFQVQPPIESQRYDATRRCRLDDVESVQ